MSHSSAPERENGAVITDWRPEDPAFWQQRGHRVASRNLWISVPCLLLAFCVWMLFSAVAVNLPKVGFTFTTDQLFMLTALPSLSGALLRVPYAFMVPVFGGRRWTAFSTGIMIVPCVWLGFAVQDTSTPFSVFVIISLLCGFAGANFASSMANISFFFPKAKQGGALGINGGLGNMGVSVMQLIARWRSRSPFLRPLAAVALSRRMVLPSICRTPPGSGCRSWWSSPWQPGSL
jgi:NNP family nitrate/nitrite transporter-like MFS transporter